MPLPRHVTLVEVSPRDGLQNEPVCIPTDVKIEFINLLSKTGLPTIEATSFVSPKQLPQLADGAAVLNGIQPASDVHYPVLVPNRIGCEHALAAGAKAISVLTAASETFSQHNTHCSITEGLSRVGSIMQLAKEHHIAVRAYISCVLDCPYEGRIAPEPVCHLAKALIRLGCDQIVLGDTLGVSTANRAVQLLQLIMKDIDIDRLAIHFHDTYGQALTNIYAALHYGIHTIDASVGGLGGCPYAPGAGGNVATEDVLHLLNGLGIKTNVNISALLEANQFIFRHLNQTTRSKVAQALLAPLSASNAR